MQVLENEIGGALLERTAAGVRPTDAGYALATLLPLLMSGGSLQRNERITGFGCVHCVVISSGNKHKLQVRIISWRTPHPGASGTLLQFLIRDQVMLPD